jgi:hypothetical protein
MTKFDGFVPDAEHNRQGVSAITDLDRAKFAHFAM